MAELAYNIHEKYDSKNVNGSDKNKENLSPIRDGNIDQGRAPKWDYYKRDKSGKFVSSSYKSGLGDTTIPGKNGTPDTIRSQNFTKPPQIPKHNIN